jgi:deazaflavin-dependent oxidoreductase (nitroreductase family)
MNGFQNLKKAVLRMVTNLASHMFVSAFLARALYRVDGFFLWLSGQRFSLTSLFTGLPIVILKTTGARTGKSYATPLIGMIAPRKVVFIASYFGGNRNPGWYYNLKAHPAARVVIEGVERDYLAREATEEERPLYWQQGEKVYPNYANYREWASHRHIPIMILEEQ